MKAILRIVKPIRKSVLTNKHSCISKGKLKVNDVLKNYDQKPRFKQKKTKGYQLGWTWQVCHVFLRVLSP